MPTRSFIPTAEWEDERQVRGLRGEHAAMAYLMSCGWYIEAHRFKLGRHDVDIVARRDPIIAFVEVKTRRSDRFGRGVEAVNRRKQRTIAKVAEVWRLRFGRAGDEYRFDAVQVDEGSGGECEVIHVEDAWRLI